jgi:hypothetical protein
MPYRPHLKSSRLHYRETIAYSHISCLDAASGVLQIRTIDEETQSDGQLNAMRWRVSPFTNQEFLTATIILCFLVRGGREPFADKERANREEEIKTAESD